MKVLKKQGLTLFLIAALIVTLTLGIVFMMPARTANAEEFVPKKTETVADEQALLAAVKNAGDTPTLIKLDASIELKTSAVSIGQNQTIAIDLNGHTLSRAGWVIVNWWGKLYLQDSSSEKTGTIADANTNGGTNVMGLVYNYGEMHSSVNYDVVYSSCVAITNQLRLTGEDNTEYICNPSLTITGGTIKHRGSSNNGVTLLEVIDGDVTIEGGTFITEQYHGSNTMLLDVSSTYVYPPDYLNVHLDYGTDYVQNPEGGFMSTPVGEEKSRQAMEQLQPIVEAYDAHRESTITINDGDFTSFDSKCGVLNVAAKVERCTGIHCGSSSAGWGSADAEDYNATVSITGGRWGRDLSGYVPEGKWMDLIEETTGDGKDTYYTVRDVDRSRVGAEVTIKGVTRPYIDFLSAWNAAKTTVAEEHIIKLLQDSTIKSLSLEQVSGDMVLDLNGHKLKIDPEASNAKHIAVSNSIFSYPNRFIIRDTSVYQNGELELSASKGIGRQSYFYLYTGATKVVLESGTIRQTGLAPESYKDYSIDSVTSSNDDRLYEMSLFKFSPTGLSSGYLDKYENEFLDSVTIKGGNIVSELSFGTAENVVTTHPGVLVGYTPKSGNYEFGVVSKEKDFVPNKDKIIILDLEAYLADGTKSCIFSWNFDDILSPKGLSSSPRGNDYIVSKVGEGEYFLVGSSSEKFGTLAQALSKAQEGDTIFVLQDATIDEAVTINKGITLDLNATTDFTVTVGEQGSITLTDGASIKYGAIEGGVTAAGDAQLSGTKITGEINVTGGTLSIDSGIYEGAFTVSGAELAITGGSFRGDQIQTLDQYFGNFLGAYIEAGKEYVPDTLYPVQIAPNLAAQKWYKDNSAKENFEIATTDEWNYFSLYVNSGADSFEKKTVKLTAPLNFGGNPSGVSLFAAREAATPFLPAGNVAHPFMGSFDGQENEITGIVAREKLVGLFGYTKSVTTISNVTVRNSTFTVGNGYLDELNAGAGTLAGGAIIGEGYNGTVQNNIILEKVTVDHDINGYSIFSGALIGHTWGSVTVTDLSMTESSVASNWKAGGLVGYYEGDFTLTNGEISNVEVDTSDSFFAPGVLAGHANGTNTTFTDCKVEAPDQSLIGTSYNNRSKNVTITGAETDIHVESLGTTGTESVKIDLTKDEKGNASQVQFSEKELPSNLTITQNGTDIVKEGQPTEAAGDLKTDPENGSFIFESNPKNIDLYTEGSLHVGSYDTITAALADASEGDRIYVNADHTEEVTVGGDKNVALNLLGHTLMGKITVEGTLTLENGFVKAESGDAVTVRGGTLTLAVPALGEDETEIEELKITATSGKAVNGDYTVEKNDNVVCVRVSENENEIYLAKEHEVGTYTVAGAVITVRCKHDDVELGTVTLVAPENTTFSGEKIEATVVVAPDGFVEAPKITYKDANGAEVQEITAAGTYTASITLGDVTASITIEVKQKELVISNIRDTITYQGETELTLTVTDYDLTDLAGNPVELDGVTVTVTLQKSKYNVGAKQVVLISAINMTGNDNYALHTAGNEVFMELDVTPAALTVRVDKSGKVVYEGFAKGDDESVLEGELHLEWVDNGDGTSTVTPSGLTSANYVITFESGIVENEQSSNALWITLAVVGGVIVALGAVAVVYAVRRKKN